MVEKFVATQAKLNKAFLNQNIHTSEQLKQLSNKVDALATHKKCLKHKSLEWINSKHLQLALFLANHNQIRKVMLTQ